MALPMFMDIKKIKEKSKKKTVFTGLLGMQGTGKTTLGHILAEISKSMNFNLLSISIDDFYLTFQERNQLKRQFPYFFRRGPPGTHDTDLLLKLFLDVQKENFPYNIPVFDKSLYNGDGDRSQIIQTNSPLDCLLLEGWFVGLKSHQSPQQLFEYFEKKKFNENQQKLAVESNSNLAIFEEKIWKFFDYQIALVPENENYSLLWRKEAERKMREATGNGMTDKEIEEFVNYFWISLPPEIFINNPKNPLTHDFHSVISVDFQRHIKYIKHGRIDI